MRRGISLVSLTVVIVIMVILAGIVIISGIDTVDSVTINTFALEMLNIQNAVDEFNFRYEKYPAGESITLDLSQIQDTYRQQFEYETVTDNIITFKVVDLASLGIANTEFGNNKSEKDVYALSETTGIVYYLDGLKYEDEEYYTLTDKLFAVANITNNAQITSKDVKVYDVIFTPSSLKTTNKPINVMVRVPKRATINSIVTTENKSVGQVELIGMYKQVQVNMTSEDTTGNYTIIVNYTYNNVTKTAQYVVDDYEDVLPIISYSETVEGDLKTINVTIDNNKSTLKEVKYEEEIVSKVSYFEHYGKNLTNNQFIIKKDEYFTIYVETTSGEYVVVNNMPEDWKENIIDIVDGVPIPKGFTASSVDGENKKDSGLVIYEGEEYVTNSNVEQARRERNQYVWVPIPEEQFKTRFVRSNFGLTKYPLSNTPGTDYWEVELDLETNMPLAEQNPSYVSKTTTEEVIALYESVKKYHGFYVARYEAGADIQKGQAVNDSPIYSMMGKAPRTKIVWGNSMTDENGGVVETSRSIYPKDNVKFGVVSTLIYGVQWDAILQWWLDTDAVVNVSDEIDYGNYLEHVINPGDLNDGAMYRPSDKTLYSAADNTITKDSSTAWGLTTGALKAAKVNNIYDMAGNIYEWTMEGRNVTAHIVRGRTSSSSGSSTCVAVRGMASLNEGSSQFYGYRVALYLK